MSRYTYTGDQKVIYSQYLDVTDPEAPKTLEPEPGGTYDIKQADSPQVIQPDGQFTDQELPMPPDDAWTAAVEAKATDGEHIVSGKAAKQAAAKIKESGTDA